MIAIVVVMFDEAAGLALGLGMVRCPSNVIHTLGLESVRSVTGDIGRAVVAQQSNLWTTSALPQPDAWSVSVSVTSSACMVVRSPSSRIRIFS